MTPLDQLAIDIDRALGVNPKLHVFPIPVDRYEQCHSDARMWCDDNNRDFLRADITRENFIWRAIPVVIMDIETVAAQIVAKDQGGCGELSAPCCQECSCEAAAVKILGLAREKIATWMIHAGFATGHGDTIDDLLAELDGQVEELRGNLDNAVADLRE